MVATTAEEARPVRAAGVHKTTRDANNHLERGVSRGSTSRVAPAERAEELSAAAVTRRRHSTGSVSPPQTGRRRSSFLVDLARAMKQTNGNSTNTVDERGGGGVPDIPQKFNALFEHLCGEKHTTAIAVEASVAAWRLEHLGEIDDARVLSFFDDALPSMMVQHIQLEKNHRVATKKTVCWTVLLTLFDTLSDYSAYVVLEMAGSGYATPMLVILMVSMMMQALTVRFVTKEGPIATAGALLGLKPILDGINIVFGIPPRAGAIESLAAFGFTRVIEAASESIPFAVMQSLALMERRSVAQWISFAISVVNIAHAVASVDYSFDTNPGYRAAEPLLYGYYPPGARGDGLFAAITIFALGYVTAKLVALAVFGTVAGAFLALVLVGESAILLLARFAVDNWRWFNAAGDNASFSMLFHFLLVYPTFIAAPFPFGRHPFFLTPRIYLGLITWTLLVSNPLMLVLSFRYYEIPPSIGHPWIIWAIWGSATIFSVLAALLSFVLIEPDFRDTFYRHRPMRKHVREGHWVRSTKWDGTQIACNDDLDAVRAWTLQKFAKAYWPVDLARQWVRDGWAQWLSTQPPWLTDEWRERVPLEEWLAGSSGNDGDSAVVSMTKQEAIFRQIVRTPPWDLNAREFEAFLDKRFVNSTELSSATSEMAKRGQLAHQVVGAGGVGLLARCCTSRDEKSPWVQISHAVDGKPLRGHVIRIQQLTNVLCASGLPFYYQLYVASASQSPLHGYDFVKPMAQKPHYQLLLVRDRETGQLAILTLTSFGNLECTQMGREKMILPDIQKAGDVSEFTTSLYHWGSTGNVMFILGEYCGGGPLTRRIKPHVGIESDEDFWRLAFQLAQGLVDLHIAGLVKMDVRVRSTVRSQIIPLSSESHLHATMTSLSLAQAQNAMLTDDGDVRYGHLGLHYVDDVPSFKYGSYRSTGSNLSGQSGPETDVDSVALLLYCMSSGDQKKTDLSTRPVDGLLAKIRDPLKRELISRSLLAAKKASAEELVRIVSELAPFDVRSFSKSTRGLIEVEQRAKAAGVEEARRAAKLQAATPCVMICDPGNGIDCEISLVQLRALRDLGHVEPLGVIANLWPSSERARLLRGTLDVLGMHHVPVGIGSDGGASDGQTEQVWESAQSYITTPGSEREGSIVTGQQLLQMVFERAAPASITLLCTSSLKDAAIFLRDSGEPFK